MYFVYAIYSIGYDKIYIGFTSDLVARLNTHNSPENKGWTSKFKPWELLYTEELPTKQQALVREKQLKSAKGRLFIRSLIKNSSVGLVRQPADDRQEVAGPDVTPSV